MIHFIISVMGILFNSMLLYLIRNFSSSYLGNYKYLLAIFAVFDIFLGSFHAVMQPVREAIPFFTC